MCVSTAIPLTDHVQWTHPCMLLQPQIGIDPAYISFDYEHLSCPHAERDDCDGIDRSKKSWDCTSSAGARSGSPCGCGR